MGATGGGLWKTTDGGTTWKPVTDGQFDSSSIGAVAVADSNPDVVYVGTGESQHPRQRHPGRRRLQVDRRRQDLDAHRPRRHAGHRQASASTRPTPTSSTSPRSAITPAPNPERGVFRSKDGGKTWDKILFRDDKTGAQSTSSSIRTIPQVIYAALWQAYRNSWEMSSGGPGSGLFKSTDGGDTWTEITRNPGLPQGDARARSASRSRAPTPTASTRDRGRRRRVLRLRRRGRDLDARRASDRELRQRAFYYTRIYADPEGQGHRLRAERQLPQVDRRRQDVRRRSRVPHGDNHDLWIAPNDPNRMVEANDGGANVSVNGGETWTRAGLCRPRSSTT